MCRILVYIIAALLIASALPASAGDWQWPSDMTLAGFSISGIRGTVGADGSGSATGSLQIPNAGSQKVSLNRSSRGDVTGTVAMSARTSAGEVQGNFTIDRSTLRGSGTLRCSPKPISDASFTVNSGGQFSGSGRADLGPVSIPATFSVSGSSFTLSGSAPRRAHVDTPLATYSFDGELRLVASSGKIGVVAKGTVQRTGKVSEQRSTSTVSDVQVNPSDGTGRVSVDGVSVTFDFFRS